MGRSPRLTDWEEPSQESENVDHILSGGYHETNPGQYHEINPGQYHESNPGQYHEINPGQPLDLGEGTEILSGQYHESNPGQPVALPQRDVDGQQLHAGQYHEVNPGQYHEVNPGQYHGHSGVDPGNARYRDHHKTYTVEAKAGDFIIGEVGRIDVNNGQTLEGVRYTALDGEVSQRRISQILERFFGTRSGS